MNLDLDKVQEAMDWLAETPEGDQALAGLAEEFETVRKSIPTELNNAELRYVLERLVQQRNLENWDKRLEAAEVSGFEMQSASGLFPQTHVARGELDPYLAQTARVLNYGFLIKASIPGARF